MTRAARILVIESPSAPARTLAARLRGLGLETVGAQPATAGRLIALDGGRPDFVVVDARAMGAGGASFRDIVSGLEKESIPSLLVGADPSHSAGEIPWHDVIPGEPSAVFLANRIQAAMRLRAMHSELDRRIATCARYGVDAPSPVGRPAELDEASILVLGPGAEFGAIDDALSPSASIVGAFSPAMTIDYLGVKRFDLIIADMGAGFETVCDLARDLRHDARFYAVPLLLIGTPAENGWIEAALSAGITEVLPAPVTARSLRSRALSLAREHRFAASLKAVYDDARHQLSGDALTGLYTRGFLMAHLASLLNETEPVHFRLAVFEIANIGEINEQHGYPAGDRIIRQIGIVLGNLLRGVDLPARLEGARYAAILIDADHDGAATTARRIAGFVNSTAFGAPGDRETVAVRLRVGIADPAGMKSPDDLIAAAKGDMR